MEKSNIVRYSASAGSGKTYALAKEFIAHLYKCRDMYKHILLVTFTNKAATELRYRILDELAAIASGKQTGLFSDLKQLLPQYSDNQLCSEAKQILSNILNDYSHFSVCTIDSFFQKIFKNFTREIGVSPNFNLYVEHSELLRETISELIKNLEVKESIYNWFVDFAQEEFEEGKTINLQKSLFNNSKEIFKERYKLLSGREREDLSNLDEIKNFINQIYNFNREFVERCKRYAEDIMKIFEKFSVETADVVGGERGLFSALSRFYKGDVDRGFSNTTRKNVEDNKWTSSKCSKKREVETAVLGGAGLLTREFIAYYDNSYRYYLTNKIILKTVRLAAMLEKVKEKLRQKTGDENSYILADTGDFLMQLIGGDQTPFIYEKIGSRYDIYMIDEFQDTSYIQYKNFLPLLYESISVEDGQSLIVGDIKQSIYRWRNGDWSIFAQKVPADFSSRIVDKQLNTNWRSLPEIVNFNNTLFTTLPQQFDNLLQQEGIDIAKFSLTNIYNNVVQRVAADREGGYVELEVVQSAKNDSGEEIKPKEVIMKRLPKIIEECEDSGYLASDIAILVRSGREGEEIIKSISQYAASPAANSRYNFNIISVHSLSIGSSPVANFVISAMKRVNFPNNALNNISMLRNYLFIKKIDASTLSLLDFSLLEADYLPPNFDTFLLSLKSKPLFEISEAIIDFFAISFPENSTILSSLQDQVLHYMNDNSSNIADFVEWWDEEGSEQKVSLSGEQDGINVMTIHKSKGLQFKVVIVPFITWDLKSKSGGEDTLIWGKSDESPYSSVSVLPLPFQKDLGNTFFADYYFNELQESYLDALNLLYVAFTRPKERLYGFTYKSKSPLCKIMAEIISEYAAKQDNVDNNGGGTIYKKGMATLNRATTENSEQLSFEYNVFNYNGRLQLRIQGDNIDNKRVYGTILHEVLSKVKYVEDIDGAVAEAVGMGLIARDKEAEIISMLKQKIKDDGMEHWFSRDLSDIITEAEIITGKGEIRRPDRIIVRNGKMSLLDYKFGKERKSYQYQIDEYRKLLEAMGYCVEESRIWYLDDY